MPHLDCRPASDFSIPELAHAVTRGFEGYYVPIEMSAAGLLAHIRLDSVNLNESRVALAEDAVVGIALMARRGWSSRLAAMGVTMGWRGKGVGRFLINRVLEDARARSDRRMVLEVIEANDPAIRLYESAGFRKVRRLVSMAYENTGSESHDELQQTDIRELARLIAACGLTDLPWQLSAETIAQYGAPFRAYRLNGALALISDPAQPNVSFLSLLVEPRFRGQGRAARLIEAILASHPGRSWRLPAIFPEEIIGPFEAAGFHREPLSQWQMELVLLQGPPEV